MAGPAFDAALGRAFDSGGPVLETNGSGSTRPVSAAAPVGFSGQVIGAIYAGFDPPSHATPAQLVWTTECYARLAGLCMSRDDLTLAAALGSASFDPLTGCLTYGAIVEVLKAEMQRTDRRGHRLSACMIDLDGFKRVNDEQGHLEGNRVLSAVGVALRGAARRYDAVGRFGGDEFMVVLPETGNGDGERIAERFLASLRPAVRANTGVPVDASAGIMEWDGESSPLKLLDQADAMMREAKRAGGGRVQSLNGRAKLDGLTELSRYMFGSFRAGRSNRNGDPG